MIALLYGTTTGNTFDIAQKIQNQFDDDVIELFDVRDTGLAALEYFDKLIFAIPTWDYGEVQSDWDEVWAEIDAIDFSNKTIALVGLGDQYAYAEWFLDAMGILHDKISARGASIIGQWPTEGYEFDASKAATTDKKYFVGLGIDEDCQAQLTEQRITEWCELISIGFEIESRTIRATG